MGYSFAILDRHILFRRGLRTLLETEAGMECIVDASSVAELQVACSSGDTRDPDVVLIELGTARETGIEHVVAYCLEMHPTTRVLTYNQHIRADEDVDTQDIVLAIRAGAYGHVADGTTTAAFSSAIKLVMSGQVVLKRAHQVALLEAGGGFGGETVGDVSARKNRLSQRELAILSRIADGATNREIAQELDLAESTIKNHLQRIFARLDASSRGQAVAIAMKRGLL